MKKNTPLLGAHTSIAGGVLRSVERCQAISANAAQIFVKNNKQWFAPPIQEEEAMEFRRAYEDANLYFCGHSGYLINLGASGEDVRGKSIKSLTEELIRADMLGLPFLVLHPGSHGGKGEDEGLKKILDGLDECIEATAACKTKIALETTAGQGSSIGHKFEHIAWLLERVKSSERFGVCLDTAHLFEAGFDIRTGKGYKETFSQLDDTIGLEHILLVHCNDSKTPLGSRVDRHEHLGKGHIGLEAFRCLMNDASLSHVPKILETPKGEDMAEDRVNLGILSSLIGKKSL